MASFLPTSSLELCQLSVTVQIRHGFLPLIAPHLPELSMTLLLLTHSQKSYAWFCFDMNKLFHATWGELPTASGLIVT